MRIHSLWLFCLVSSFLCCRAAEQSICCSCSTLLVLCSSQVELCSITNALTREYDHITYALDERNFDVLAVLIGSANPYISYRGHCKLYVSPTVCLDGTQLFELKEVFDLAFAKDSFVLCLILINEQWMLNCI